MTKKEWDEEIRKQATTHAKKSTRLYARSLSADNFEDGLYYAVMVGVTIGAKMMRERAADEFDAWASSWTGKVMHSEIDKCLRAIRTLPIVEKERCEGCWDNDAGNNSANNEAPHICGKERS